MLDVEVSNIPWLRGVFETGTNCSSYFSYLFFVSKDAPIGRDELCERLCYAGIPARRGNLYEPLYKLDIFHDALPKYMSVLSHPRYDIDYECPNAEEANAHLVRLEMLEIFGLSEAKIFRRVLNGQ